MPTGFVLVTATKRGSNFWSSYKTYKHDQVVLQLSMLLHLDVRVFGHVKQSCAEISTTWSSDCGMWPVCVLLNTTVTHTDDHRPVLAKIPPSYSCYTLLQKETVRALAGPSRHDYIATMLNTWGVRRPEIWLGECRPIDSLLDYWQMWLCAVFTKEDIMCGAYWWPSSACDSYSL